MKNVLRELIFGKNSLSGGLVALAVVMMIGLGCFCNRDKFGDLGNTGPSNANTTSSPAATATPSPEATKAYTKADASKSQIPSEDEMQDMVKRTLLDFNSAIQKEDFSDFHSTLSKVWQRQITPEEMQSKFQGFIDGEADMSAISSMKATFTNAGEITRSTGTKTLETKGSYDTSPNDTTFELKYIAEGKEWKLIGINVVTNVKRR